MKNENDPLPELPDVDWKYDKLKDMMSWFSCMNNDNCSYITIEMFMKKYRDIIPHKIYKYRNLTKYSYNEIKEQKIYFSDPEKLNDPIDSQYIKYILQKKTGCPGICNDQFIKNILNILRKVSCFTTSYLNNLMWAHYANSHSGICIEYDYAKYTKSEKAIVELFPIVYTNNFQKFDLYDGEIDYRIIEIITFLKAKSWEYEDEWRMRIPKNFYNHLIDEKYIKIPISSIYFGCNFDIASNVCQKLMRKNIISYAHDNGINVYDLSIKSYPSEGNGVEFETHQIL